MFQSSGHFLPCASAVRLAIVSLAVAGPACAAAVPDTPAAVAGQAVLPVVEVGASREGFAAQSVFTTRSDKSLQETPQSISVVTRELLDARQATTLDEAIETVAGVTSGTLGRRGWGDFIIRGQSASDTMVLDGLRIGQANWIAQEVFGAERVEVVKGPASVYFGQVTPGGTVNIVSKRPRPEAFTQFGLTVGSHGYRQGTFDIGRPIASENGKAALRVAGMAMNSDDPTDNVSGAVSFLDAVITEAAGSQAATVGQELSGVPRRTANLLANYRFTGALHGWGAGFGFRHVGEKTSTTSAYVVPSYTVADASVSLERRGWRVQLNVKNLLDREYFAGAANATWLPVGNPRAVMLKTVADF